MKAEETTDRLYSGRAFQRDDWKVRISKTVGRRTGGGLWQLMGETSFLYDGWNVVSEICDDQSQITTNFYVWGLDLSGSLQGAGGIGGLLAAQLGTNSVFYTYDGNGNVSELINSAGTIVAHYEYSPFGETLVSIGDLAKENTFRFSTKLSEDNTGLVLYEFRPYSPSLGRWISRDPIGEKGFLKSLVTKIDVITEDNEMLHEPLYVFVYNESIGRFDPLGLSCNNRTVKIGSPKKILPCRKLASMALWGLAYYQYDFEKGIGVCVCQCEKIEILRKECEYRQDYRTYIECEECGMKVSMTLDYSESSFETEPERGRLLDHCSFYGNSKNETTCNWSCWAGCLSKNE